MLIPLCTEVDWLARSSVSNVKRVILNLFVTQEGSRQGDRTKFTCGGCSGDLIMNAAGIDSLLNIMYIMPIYDFEFSMVICWMPHLVC